MKIIHFFTLFTFVFLMSCQESTKKSNMTDQNLKNTAKGKLFIIGGGERPDFLVDRMVSEAQLNQDDYVAILPMSSEQPDSAFIFASQQFVKRKIKTMNCNFKKGEDLNPQKLDSLLKAKLIYVSGGNQNKFMAVLENTKAKQALLDAFNNGSMIAGTSAGAAMMSEKMITGNGLKEVVEQKEFTKKEESSEQMITSNIPKEESKTFVNIEDSNVEISQGMGLLKTVIIDQHFIIRSRYNRLISVAIEYPEQKAVGIDEATALLVKGDSAEVVGNAQVVVVENPTKSKTVLNGKLGATNMVLHLYLNGQKFSLVK